MIEEKVQVIAITFTQWAQTFIQSDLQVNINTPGAIGVQRLARGRFNTWNRGD